MPASANAAKAQVATVTRVSLIDILLWKERVAPLEHWAQVGPDRVGDDAMARRIGVERLVEVQGVVADDSDEKERHERNRVPFGEADKQLMKLEGVSEASDRRSLHRAEQHANAASLST